MGFIHSGQRLSSQFLIPQGYKQLYFCNAQETASKDVEREYGILQAQFTIV